MHHGTLLFDVNIEDLAEALNVSADKIESKGIKSIRSRVGNIREFLKEDMTIDEFRERLQRRLSNDYESEEIKLPEEAILRISETARDKFASWAWTYGESPPFNYRFEKRFPGGKVGVFIHIKEGLIRECKFYGDYLGVLETEGFEAGLKGLKYDPQTVEKAMEGMDLTSYFGPITRNELLEIMFSG